MGMFISDALNWSEYQPPEEVQGALAAALWFMQIGRCYIQLRYFCLRKSTDGDISLSLHQCCQPEAPLSHRILLAMSGGTQSPQVEGATASSGVEVRESS